MSDKNTSYYKQMPLEVIHKISGLIHLQLVSEIKITENKGFWDIEVTAK